MVYAYLDVTPYLVSLALNEQSRFADEPSPGRNDLSAASAVPYAAVTTILDSLDALVYVSDLTTHEILFLNNYGRKIWGQDAVGKPCWQVLQKGCEGPCGFCTNTKLLNERGEPTGVHVWEIQNTTNGRWYQCRDQVIPWIDGRLVRMEIATDITERKQAEDELREAKQRAESLARTDELTGLNNRRAFFELGTRELKQAIRAQRDLAVIMFDVDYFKRINDRYGHFVGDQVLRTIAQRAQELTRDTDVLGRLGGEEFALVLPDTDLPLALDVAERLRTVIGNTPINAESDPIFCTSSFGVAALQGRSKSLSALLAEADDQLLFAKRNGRNRIEAGR